jgi:hypothetical protein
MTYSNLCVDVSESLNGGTPGSASYILEGGSPLTYCLRSYFARFSPISGRLRYRAGLKLFRNFLESFPLPPAALRQKCRIDFDLYESCPHSESFQRQTIHPTSRQGNSYHDRYGFFGGIAVNHVYFRSATSHLVREIYSASTPANPWGQPICLWGCRRKMKRFHPRL